MVISLVTINVQAKKTKTTTNGGPMGYRNVTQTCEHHWFSPNNCTLKCSEPGNEACVWDGCSSSGIITKHDNNELESYALQSIFNGVLMGSIVRDGITITWNASNYFNYNIIIHDLQNTHE